MLSRTIEIENTGKINIIKMDCKCSFTGKIYIFTICGMGQPPRDFAAEWTWDGNEHEYILIYISNILNKQKILDWLAPYLEEAKNINGLYSNSFPKHVLKELL